MLKFNRVEPGYFIPSMTLEKHLSYPSIGNDDCFLLEENSQWFQARNKVLEETLIDFQFDGDFIDVGAGNGYQLSFFQKGIFNRLGIKSGLCEPGVVGCTNATNRGVENVYCCIFDELPIEEFKIGAIGLFDVIEHIEDDVSFLKDIVNRVPNGTKIYITVPALKSLWSAEDEYAGHFRRYNRSDVKRIIDNTNLKFIYSSYFFSYYVPFVWLLRVLPEKMGKKYTNDALASNEKDYHKRSKKLNSILNFLHWIEMKLSKIGIKPLFGTSRLMVFSTK
jgi:hypothetical protein